MNFMAAIEQPHSRFNKLGAWIVLPVLILHGLLRLRLYVLNVVPFNSDEAIVALMARHIALGHPVPVFFYGQAYMGSLDAIFIAIGFRIFGEHVYIIRIVQFLLYSAWVLTTYWLLFKLTKTRILPLIGVMFFIVPTINVLLYTSVSLGGYGEALVIGNLILLLGLSIQTNSQEFSSQMILRWLILGLLIGFGFWVFGLTLVYSAAVIIYLMYQIVKNFKRRSLGIYIKNGVALISGILIGCWPVIYYVVSSSQTAVTNELFGSAIASNQQSLSLITEIGTRLLSLIILGFPVAIGARPPWSVEWLVLPLLPFVILFWGAAFVFWKQKSKRWEFYSPGTAIVLMVGLITMIGFVFTPFGNDPSGRYFLPLYIPMILIGSALILDAYKRWRQWFLILPIFLIAYNFLAVNQIVRKNPPGLTTQFDQVAQINNQYMEPLIDFLKANEINRGYTNYWVAYPLAFMSEEELIFIPVLPYHEDFRYTTRDNRFSPYNDLVAASDKVAYITTNHPDLDNYLRNMFRKQNISWLEKSIGDYQVFYYLSRAVRVGEIGLGGNHE